MMTSSFPYRFVPSTISGLSVSLIADVVINEVHYDADPKTEFVELYNTGEAPVDLGGWRFSDGISLAVAEGISIPAGGYLVVAEDASALGVKFPTIPGATSNVEYPGSLANDGETLELGNALGEVVDEVTYRAEFPWPISPNGEGNSMQLLNPDLENDLGGAWRGAPPTPGRVNEVFTGNAPPLIRQVSHKPWLPKADEAITIRAKITDSDGVSSVMLAYQIVSPGNFIPAFLPNSIGTVTRDPDAPLQANPAFEDPGSWIRVAMNDEGSGQDIYSAIIPSQEHRTLVRYRIEASDTKAATVQVPYPDDPSLNFSMFVYNGVPDYVTGATTYSSDVLTALPVYTKITRDSGRQSAYAYSTTGDGGDFFGLATIVQDIDGRLLDDRKLPNGNIYKLKDGVIDPLALQRHQTRRAVADGSDFQNIKNNLNSDQSEAWLSQHVDWDQWSRYHAVVEAVRHYDYGTPSTHFKNRAWSFSEAPKTPFGLLRVIPHDHDASWSRGYHDNLNNVGNSIGTGFPWAAIFDDIRRPPTGTEKAPFTRNYRNVLREFRQLLWQEETVLPTRNFEWNATWESGELTDFELAHSPPANATRVGHHYRARVRHADSSGRWSDWCEPLEFTSTAPNTGGLIDALVISEIMYHPEDPDPGEIAAGFFDDNDFEFIEIFNAGDAALSLENVRFTKGIDFDFSGVLEAVKYLLVVRNRTAFEFRYGAGLPIAGE